MDAQTKIDLLLLIAVMALGLYIGNVIAENQTSNRINIIKHLK